jgi:hypothetical protein
MSEPAGCAEVRDLLPEFALGSLTGHDRAEVLRHLMRCPSCRRELDGLSRVADELLLMAPQQEPSAGFEAAVLGRIGLSDARPQKPRARFGKMLLRAAALVLVAALGAGAVWWHTAGDRGLARHYKQTLSVADGRYLTAVPIVASDRDTASYSAAGYVFAYQGNPSWLMVTISAAPADGRYNVTMVAVDGESFTIGACQATASSCAIGNTVNVPVSEIQAVRLTQPGVPTLIAQFH